MGRLGPQLAARRRHLGFADRVIGELADWLREKVGARVKFGPGLVRVHLPDAS